MKNLEQGKREFTKSGPVRVFFAIWPDAEVGQALHAYAKQQQMICGGRVMRAETLHLTLLFIGNVAVDRLPELQQAVSGLEASAFQLKINHFAGWKHNSIGYVAPLESPRAMMLLTLSLQDRMDRAGFAYDGKAFKPHVTLLRNMEKMPSNHTIQPITWTATEFVLVRSVLDSSGSRYEVLARWPLSQIS